jgi:plasmid stabilization system protein ParE
VLEIRYLPAYQKELAEIVLYISYTLKAPMAARNFRQEADKAIKNLRNFPLAHRKFPTQEKLEYEYRMLTVKNYYIFYSVDDFIKIHHIYYKGRDFSKLIK